MVEREGFQKRQVKVEKKMNGYPRTGGGPALGGKWREKGPVPQVARSFILEEVAGAGREKGRPVRP